MRRAREGVRTPSLGRTGRVEEEEERGREVRRHHPGSGAVEGQTSGKNEALESPTHRGQGRRVESRTPCRLSFLQMQQGLGGDTSCHASSSCTLPGPGVDISRAWNAIEMKPRKTQVPLSPDGLLVPPPWARARMGWPLRGQRPPCSRSGSCALTARRLHESSP